ncbi:hypothetical protein [Hydrogenobacter thermophilus]|uniref:hypothetical protein n=1 Tax=Hydrogenobacter thermophilus TaxID=940 RepID=UPI0030F8DE9B
MATLYRYKTGKYVRQKLASKKGCVDYKIIRVKKRPGRKLLICITKSGKTKAVALLRALWTTKGRRQKYRAKVKRLKR